MKKLFIISIMTCSVFSCSKKATPSTSTASTQPVETKAPETRAPDETKISTATTESAESIAGHATFEAKCGRCHGLKNTADYTVKQWGPILNNMAQKARLDSTEKANVLAYVTSHAKAGS